MLEDCCRRAAELGVAVLAAESNDGSPSCPASLDSVIAVSGEAPERQVYAYRCDPHLPRRFSSYGGHQRVAWIDRQSLFISGNSFAAARPSGIVALILGSLGPVPRDQLLHVLRYNSINGPNSAWSALTGLDLPHMPSRSIGWIRRAAIYPFTKEMHSLVRFRHLLPFELVGAADVLARGCVGKDAGELVGVQPMGVVVTANLNEALRDADTLILGFTGRLVPLASTTRAP